MLTLLSASAWQSCPSVPGRSSSRMVNSFMVGIVEPPYGGSRGRAEGSCEIQRYPESYSCKAGAARPPSLVGVYPGRVGEPVVTHPFEAQRNCIKLHPRTLPHRHDQTNHP